MGREFEIRREVELAAKPEQVWEAVATEAGRQAWLFPMPVPPYGEEGSPVQTWDPPNHLYIRSEGPDGSFNALEYTIEGREGGRTTLRYVHSGIFDDEGWDDQYDAVDQHTDFYLHTLGQYLEHFAGRGATYVGDVPGGIAGPEASTRPDGFDRLKRALGVERASEGEQVDADLDGAGRLDGVIDYARGPFLGIRTSDGLYRFFGRNAFGGPVGIALHDFGGGGADQSKQALTAWLNSIYD
jgi:uncharacterized protein YndB with AHSA1/START domain